MWEDLGNKALELIVETFLLDIRKSDLKYIDKDEFENCPANDKLQDDDSV